MTPDQEIREKALSMANDSGANADSVLERAAKYEKFLKGETGSTETPLPIGEGDQPDALHG